MAFDFLKKTGNSSFKNVFPMPPLPPMKMYLSVKTYNRCINSIIFLIVVAGILGSYSVALTLIGVLITLQIILMFLSMKELARRNKELDRYLAKNFKGVFHS